MILVVAYSSVASKNWTIIIAKVSLVARAGTRHIAHFPPAAHAQYHDSATLRPLSRIWWVKFGDEPLLTPRMYRELQAVPTSSQKYLQTVENGPLLFFFKQSNLTSPSLALEKKDAGSTCKVDRNDIIRWSKIKHINSNSFTPTKLKNIYYASAYKNCTRTRKILIVLHYTTTILYDAICRAEEPITYEFYCFSY